MDETYLVDGFAENALRTRYHTRHVAPGGMMATATAQAATLGVRTELLSMVGDDEEGRAIVSALHGHGVVRLDYPAFGLLGGDYYLSVGVWPDEYRSYTTGEAYDHRPSVGIVHMVDQRADGAGVAGFPAQWAHEADPSGPSRGAWP